MKKIGTKPKSSHLSEVLAAGLSFKTDADLRMALRAGALEATIDLLAYGRRSEQLIGHMLLCFPYYDVEQISGLRERLIAENEGDIRTLEFLDIGPLHQVLASAQMVGQWVDIFLKSMSDRISERYAPNGLNSELSLPSAIVEPIGQVQTRGHNETIIAAIEEAVRENSRQLLNTFKHLEAATPWRSTFDFQQPEFAADGADRTERVRTLLAQTRRYAAALSEFFGSVEQRFSEDSSAADTFYESLRQNRHDAEGTDYTTLVPMLAGLMNGIMERMSGFLSTTEEIQRKVSPAQNTAADAQVTLEG